MNIEKLSESIFNVTSDSFFSICLDVFNYQKLHNPIYEAYIEYIDFDESTIKHYSDFPFLPIETFKHNQILSGEDYQKVFMSSGTGGARSKHFIKDLNLYKTSFLKGFEHFYPEKDYVLLAVVPSYLEQGDSSLIYMIERLIQDSNHPLSGYYKKDESIEAIIQQIPSNKPIYLFGVTYALIDLAEEFPLEESYQNLTVMDTGGMKGRKMELLREEVHKILCKGFNTSTVHSEYSMTELMSQAYSKGNGQLSTPPWMKVLYRDLGDPFEMKADDGAINIIDLANLHSCSFIATNDIGKRIDQNHFEVLGRMDHSDQRGCSQLYL